MATSTTNSFAHRASRAFDAPSSTRVGGKVRRKLHVALWAAQILLAIAFGFAGVMKLATPIAELSAALPWTGDVPAALVRFIGAAELVAAIGLILPSVLHVAPVLTPLAAIGLAAVMLLAIGFHLVRGEYDGLIINVLLGTLAGFVAWGRLTKVPIRRRGWAAPRR